MTEDEKNSLNSAKDFAAFKKAVVSKIWGDCPLFIQALSENLKRFPARFFRFYHKRRSAVGPISDEVAKSPFHMMMNGTKWDER